ncbi:MAG TPA: hypothetical protein VE889_05540 [Actinomycetota bacterium]|nr:hypothetical protein [Actinomycetota bacterium]
MQQTRVIRTTPFVNKNVSMRDNEGSAYVPRNRSLWLADDNGRAVYEVNHTTGALKRVIGRTQFEAARRAGGGPRAGVDRTRDFESMAYDRAHDTLYVFSSNCCDPSVLPTAFRLKRNAKGVFHVASYRRLPRTLKVAAAAWNSAKGKIFIGHGKNLRTYNYRKNKLGRIFRVPNLTDITGMGFSPDGRFLMVTTGDEQLRRVRWATKRLVAGWTFGLDRFGIHDSRAVAVIRARFYVSDGDDARSNADPLKYAVHVLRRR